MINFSGICKRRLPMKVEPNINFEKNNIVGQKFETYVTD